MRINPQELESKLTAAAKQVVPDAEAKYFAEETIEAHLRKSPRTNPLKESISDLEACIKLPDNKLKFRVDLPSFISIDFHGQGPAVYIKRIHDELQQRSEKNGLAMAAFTNSKSMDTLHFWVQGLAKRGMLAIAVCNGGPAAVVPHNGTKGLFGTNPMAYGVPGENGEIFCVDMATSEIPYFEILGADKNNQPLKEHSAVNKNGEFTTVPSEAIDRSQSKTDPITNIVPLGGGYKGYYLVYLMEVLTSALIGTPASTQMSANFVPEEHGAILIAFNPPAMGSAASFKKSIQSLHESLKAQRPKEGESIRLPGEENNKRYADLKTRDIEVDNSAIAKLDALVAE